MGPESAQFRRVGLFPRLKLAVNRYTLWWTLGFSLLLHASLIAWRFADPVSFNRVFEDTALEVVLVNARSDKAPERAQAMAQVNLAGGGQGAVEARASSPLPSRARSIRDCGCSMRNPIAKGFASMKTPRRCSMRKVSRALCPRAPAKADASQPRHPPMQGPAP